MERTQRPQNGDLHADRRLLEGWSFCDVEAGGTEPLDPEEPEQVAEEGKAHAEASGEVQRTIDIFHYFSGKAADLDSAVKLPSTGNQNLYTVKEPIGGHRATTSSRFQLGSSYPPLRPATLSSSSRRRSHPAPRSNSRRRLTRPAYPTARLTSLPALAARSAPSSSSMRRSARCRSPAAARSARRSTTGTDAGKRIQTELSGKNPTVISPSAGIVVSGGFGTTGQSCTACSHAVVHEDIYDEFVDELPITGKIKRSKLYEY